jgi:Protein of unknown function (DUF1579)
MSLQNDNKAIVGRSLFNASVRSRRHALLSWHIPLPVLSLTLVCLSTLLASGQDVRSRLPQPAAEMRQLEFFNGTFECIGETQATPITTAHVLERTISGRTDLDGLWFFMRFEDKVTKENPMAIRGNWELTFDVTQKQFVALWADNLGRWFPQTSPGWNGNTIVFVGDFTLNGKRGSVRDTFVRTGERVMMMMVDIKMGEEWNQLLKINCRN